MLAGHGITFVYTEFNDVFERRGAAGGALLPICDLLYPLGFRMIATYTDQVFPEEDLFVVANALFVDPAAASLRAARLRRTGAEGGRRQVAAGATRSPRRPRDAPPAAWAICGALPVGGRARPPRSCSRSSPCSWGCLRCSATGRTTLARPGCSRASCRRAATARSWPRCRGRPVTPPRTSARRSRPPLPSKDWRRRHWIEEFLAESIQIQNLKRPAPS